MAPRTWALAVSAKPPPCEPLTIFVLAFNICSLRSTAHFLSLFSSLLRSSCPALVFYFSLLLLLLSANTISYLFLFATSTRRPDLRCHRSNSCYDPRRADFVSSPLSHFWRPYFFFLSLLAGVPGCVRSSSSLRSSSCWKSFFQLRNSLASEEPPLSK